MTIIKRIKDVLEIIAAIVTITGIGIIGIWEPLKKNIPYVQKQEVIHNVEQIRTQQSKRYIDSLLGVPQNEVDFEFGQNEINRHIYVNEYCTLICYYVNDALKAYVVIGNSKDFKYKEYRSGSELFTSDFKIAEQNSEGYLLGIKQMVGDRLDCSRFYTEYYVQHLYGDDQIVGYGICDLGYMNEEMDNAINKSVVLLEKVEDSSRIPDREILQLPELQNTRNTPINTFFTVSNAKMDAEKFVDEVIVPDYCLGIAKGDYKNMTYTYHDTEEGDNMNYDIVNMIATLVLAVLNLFLAYKVYQLSKKEYMPKVAIVPYRKNVKTEYNADVNIKIDYIDFEQEGFPEEKHDHVLWGIEIQNNSDIVSTEVEINYCIIIKKTEFKYGIDKADIIDPKIVEYDRVYDKITVDYLPPRGKVKRKILYLLGDFPEADLIIQSAKCKECEIISHEVKIDTYTHLGYEYIVDSPHFRRLCGAGRECEKKQI